MLAEPWDIPICILALTAMIDAHHTAVPMLLDKTTHAIGKILGIYPAGT
jgi:hypothetical protein